MEREYIPWEAALRSLSSLFAVFDRNEVYGPMQVGSLKTSINSALILLSVTVYIFVLLGLHAKTGQASVWSFYFCSCKLDDGACRPHWSVKIYTILKFFLNRYTLIRKLSVNRISCVFCFVLRFTQIIALSLACSTGVQACKDLTKHWFRQWMQDPEHNR